MGALFFVYLPLSVSPSVIIQSEAKNVDFTTPRQK